MLLLSVFTPLYESLIGANPYNPEYREGIFSSVGIVSIVTTIAISLVFYLGLGRWKPVFYKIKHWLIALFVSAIAGFNLAYVFTNKEISSIDGYALRFVFVNAFYAVVYFILLSVLLRRFSIFAKRTPF